MDPIRVGVIGTGWIAGTHLSVLKGIEEASVQAVADVDGERAQAFAAEAGARAFTDWRQMLESEELDALFVCTPPLAHLDPATAALEAGLPLYLEKPIARGLDDARRIVETAERTQTVCAVGYQWHALDLLDEVRRLLEGQHVGLVLGTSIGPTLSRPWFIDRQAGGGNLLERGSHHLDLVRAVGGEVERVQAAGGRVPLARSEAGGGNIDDAVTLLLQLVSGAIATVVVAWTRPGEPGTYSLDVVADEATLHLALDPQFRLTGRSRGSAVSTEAGAEPPVRSVRLFIDAARAADPAAVACTPRDAAATLAVAVAAERALETGTSVPVERG